MRSASIADLSVPALVGLTLAGAYAQAPEPAASIPVGSVEIARILKGKICTTKGGARFVFKKDGHYAYDGMWTSGGHYSVKHGAVTVLLESGLERDFKISTRAGVLFMEDTAVRCE